MEYKITYQCIANGITHRDEFYFESEDQEAPKPFDRKIIEAAMEMSTKFMTEGIGGLSIVEITPKKEN